ncbi:hypothetical protein RND71_041153 [Anisodus tanguticus]|uniref:Pectinesterase n=1 Tax=Anisodus tanguticus TaxID=243964 RepID=A0AAE1QUP8_9SOLA|nr:hypothetical protein RND71_041153 [Anisodus tanguticus]
MEFTKFLFILILLPFYQVLSQYQHETFHPYQTSYTLDPHAIIIQACNNIQNQALCLAHIQSNLDNHDGHRDPHSILRAAIQNSLNQAKLTIQSITKFSTLSASSRDQMAIEDCQELLDFSGNLKAWLSAALSNQDTCLEGFEGTDRHLENFIEGSLTQVTQLISNVLTLYVQLHSLPFALPRNESIRHENPKYPEWMTNGDKDLLVYNPNRMHVDAVVALDGSGRYRSIAQAVNEAPSYSNRRYVIYVKRGIYHENIDLKKKKTNIMLVGDGIGATVITGNRNFMQGWTTFRTATVAVSGKGFIARDITFRNTGPKTFQGVALRVDSDQSAFFRCSMEGYQDTLYAHSLRQFYRECSIYGTIDFIFGNGAAVLQNCKIFTREPLPMQKVTITAQGRKSPDQSTGFSIQDSYIYATRPTYLGRPWKMYSRTVYMNTWMSGMVQPRGWLEWYGNFALNSLWYGEYKNYGPGSSLSGRVKWPGYNIIKDPSSASFFTVQHFIDGMSWLPATGVQFSAELRILRDLFVGGTDTTTTTLEWAMTELLRETEILKKA